MDLCPNLCDLTKVVALSAGYLLRTWALPSIIHL